MACWWPAAGHCSMPRALLVPLLFPLNLAAAFPFAVQRLRGSAASAGVAALAAAALLAISFPPRHALVFFLTRAVPGLVMGEAMARGRGLRRATAWTLLLVTLQSAAVLIFAGSSIAAQMLGTWDAMWSAGRDPEAARHGRAPRAARRVGGRGGLVARDHGGRPSGRCSSCSAR